MIALGMITVAFLGIAALLTRSFFLNRVATDETIGSYLAAEGIEVTKSIIDHDVYGDPSPNLKLSWGDDVPTNSNGSYYSPVYSNTTLRGVGPEPNTPLRFASGTGPGTGYQYINGTVTPFTRVVEITKPNQYEFDVISTVKWSTGPLTNETVTDEDHFYDWHP